VGTQAAAAAPRCDLALDHPDHRRDHPPAGPRTRLTTTTTLLRQKGQTRGPMEPRPPSATAGQPAGSGPCAAGNGAPSPSTPSPAWPLPRPPRPSSPPGYAATGRSRRCTSAASPTARTHPRPGPATDPRSWPSSATSPPDLETGRAHQHRSSLPPPTPETPPGPWPPLASARHDQTNITPLCRGPGGLTAPMLVL